MLSRDQTSIEAGGAHSQPRHGSPVDPDLPHEPHQPEDPPAHPERKDEPTDPDEQRPGRAMRGTIEGPSARERG